ncbi:MAG: [ribosomal protein S18]-alanine N-acetyltransferase [Pyrinomonadaceae bacterium]|nr:[ribosomal protein S18]-alanine N-acetyltransferase [Pyrinomonadaceae bacterium]
MAVLKKIRSRLFSTPEEVAANGDGETRAAGATPAAAGDAPEATATVAAPTLPDERYDIRPLTISQLDECWRLDQRCFVDGEAYSRDTFEYLLTSPESVAYRAVTPDGLMVGFIVGLVEPQNTGHITTLGVAPEHRRRRIAEQMLNKVEENFRRRHVRTIRLEVRSVNSGAQILYRNLGYTVTQRLPRYYSNGGDGLLMIKSIE